MTVRFRAIVPKDFNKAAFDHALQRGAKQWGEQAKKDFDRVTSGWTGERPVWIVTLKVSGNLIIVEIAPKSENEGAKKWMYLDTGTQGPYPIRPKKAKALAFPSQYQAGSKPGSLRTFKGKSGGKTVFAQFVLHPGIKPRGWTKLLAEQGRRQFERWMAGALAEAVRASGHQYR